MDIKACVIINAYYDKEEYLYQAKRLKEEFEKKGINCDILKNNFFPFIVEEKIKNKISDYDVYVYFDKDKYVLYSLEKCGKTLINGYNSIEICDDKMLTYITLAENGIKIPKTLPGLLCYDKNEKVKDLTIKNIISELGFPLIIKESFGSMGKGVYLINNEKELREKCEEVKIKPHLFQKYIECDNQDVRVIVVGGKVLGAINRKAVNDFRSNVGAGGQAENYVLTEEVKTLAIKISEILNLDYCGIDLMKNGNGIYLCEVNSNAFFKAFESVTKINVAENLVELCIKKTLQKK